MVFYISGTYCIYKWTCIALDEFDCKYHMYSTYYRSLFL